MELTSTDLSPELSRARDLLAELCERGYELLAPDQHLHVLMAYDSLERAAIDLWPPPGPEIVNDSSAALTSVAAQLELVLEDASRHRALALPVAFALDYVRQVLEVGP
jgi:hypothetical protein